MNDDDRWLLPNRQSDLPGYDLIAPGQLHARREGTFLALAAIFMIATLALPLWFASTWALDLSGLPFSATELSIGVLVFPIALIAGQLASELYGSRRAAMLALATTLASSVVVGGEALTVANYPIALALALVACSAIANAANLLVFASTRRLVGSVVSRSFVATAVALLAGWSAFTLAWLAAGGELDEAIALASTPCLYAVACAIVGLVPVVIASRALSTYLRVRGPVFDHTATRRLPHALIIDEPSLPRPVQKLYSTGEMRFFAEGDELAQ
jgi:hypothetical protein